MDIELLNSNIVTSPLAYIWVGDMLRPLTATGVNLLMYHYRGSLAYTHDKEEVYDLHKRFGGTVLEVEEYSIESTTVPPSRGLVLRFDRFTPRGVENSISALRLMRYEDDLLTPHSFQTTEAYGISRALTIGLIPSEVTKQFMNDYGRGFIEYTYVA